MTGKGKAVAIILALMVLALAAAGYAGWRHYKYYDLRAAAPAAESVILEVKIPEGSNAQQVADLLAEAGVITQPRYFLNYCRATGLDSQLKAGEYGLSPGWTLDEIADAIAGGHIINYKVTVPEGFTLAQIGALLQENGLCSAEEWEQALLAEWDHPCLAEAPAGALRLEGYLYPETYFYVKDSDVYDIITMMLEQFQQVWDTELAALAAAQGRGIHETVTIASLIERERLAADECATIAGVIYNRLEREMLLQIDATVLYALGEHKEVVLNRDLEVDSPYNTYLYPGLPPGPIAAPGLLSLKAALEPEQHDYLFYVAKGDGSHEFNESFDEHTRAVNAYL